MKFKEKIAFLVVGFVFAGSLIFGLTKSGAQQLPSNPSTTKSGPQPTPPVSPTPEIVVDDDPIIIDTEVVNVLLTNLKETDVKILENGQVQEVSYFTRQVDLPMSLAILIDTSRSQERTLPEQKEAAKTFLDSFIRPAKDEVAIVSFTGEATLEQGMTNNIARLRRAVDRVEFVPPSGHIGGGVVVGTPPISGKNQDAMVATAIWDAIWITGEEVLGPSPEKTRRAIILLSDGMNTYGMKKLDDAVQAAIKSEAVIYAIGIGDNYYGGVDKGSLNKVSERTGGRAFYPRDERELREAFEQIQIEMRSQYLIAYEPTNQARDGSYRTIEIQIANPELQKQKVKLTHRQGYFAKTGEKGK
jgi:Ca-activated chloride channel homolog